MLQTSTGRTPLIEAVRNNRPAVVKALLALGASADYVNGRGQVTAMINHMKKYCVLSDAHCAPVRVLLVTRVAFHSLAVALLN